jgi:hypothetical protein
VAIPRLKVRDSVQKYVANAAMEMVLCTRLNGIAENLGVNVIDGCSTWQIRRTGSGHKHANTTGVGIAGTRENAEQ